MDLNEWAAQGYRPIGMGAAPDPRLSGNEYAYDYDSTPKYYTLQRRVNAQGQPDPFGNYVMEAQADAQGNLLSGWKTYSAPAPTGKDSWKDTLKDELMFGASAFGGYYGLSELGGAAGAAGGAGAGAGASGGGLGGASAAGATAGTSAAEFAAYDAAQLSAQGLSQAQVAATLEAAGVDSFVAADLAQLAAQGVPASQMAMLATQAAGGGAAGLGTISGYGAAAAGAGAGAGAGGGAGGAAGGAAAGTIGSMLGGAGIVAGTSLASALLGSKAAKDAASIQADATREAIAESRRAADASLGEIQRQYDTSRADLEPWRTAGGNAVRELSTLTAPGGDLRKTFTVKDFWDDPVVQLGYDFGLKEGTKSINNMAASRGMKNSGQTIKALTQFGTDYTGTKAGESRGRFIEDQNNTYNRLAGVAGTGQGAATTGVQAGTSAAGSSAQINANAGNTISGLVSGLGNARGAASIAGNNAWSGAFDNVGKFYQQQQLLEALRRQ